MKNRTTHKRLRRVPALICLTIVLLVGVMLLLSQGGVGSSKKAKTPNEKTTTTVIPTTTTGAVETRKPETSEPTSGGPTTTTSAVPAPPSLSPCNYVFNCASLLYNQRSSEASRLLNFFIPNSPNGPTIKSYTAAELSGDVVLKEGLYTDRQDLSKPRPGEKYVTFAKYLDCLDARLRVDHRKQREDTLTAEEVDMSFPYVVSLATVELGDIKTLMCNVSVPIRHLMYVINSDVTAVHNFFSDVEKAFSFTKRVHVHWPGYNMGFGSSVNYAMRDALRYTFDEVPFFFILNNDIRFAEQTLRKSLPAFRRVTLQDKKVLEALREEVAKEPSEYTPKDRRHPLLRSSDNSTLLVTSTALPDRIRYMPAEGRKFIFGKHYGGLFFDDKGDTAAFGMSRLAIETVGFMDENFYPAYYEDTDWRYRQFRLGFSDFFLPEVPFKVHYVNALFKLGNQYRSQPSGATEAEVFAMSVTNVVVPIPNLRMLYMKYGRENHAQHEPFAECHELPLDAWVMDVPRRHAIARALNLSYAFFGDRSAVTEAQKMGRSFLYWLPQEERSSIGQEVAGRSLAEVVSGAFKDCQLVRHEK